MQLEGASATNNHSIQMQQQSIEILNLECQQKLSLNSIDLNKNQKDELLEQTKNKEKKFTIVDDQFAEEIKQYCRTNFTMQDWNAILQGINSENTLQKHYGLIGLRKLLSIEKNIPIQPTIDSGLVPKIIHMAKQTQYFQLQLQSLWILANLTTGTTAQVIVVAWYGCVPVIISALSSPILAIVQQSIWAVGNLAGDSIQFRDILIGNDAIQILVKLVEQNYNSENILKHGLWALSNLCRSRPFPQYHLVKKAIHLFYRYIISGENIDQSVILDCLWAIFYHQSSFFDIPYASLQGFTDRMVQYLAKSIKQQLTLVSLKVLQKLLSQFSSLAQHFLNQNGMGKVDNCLNNKSSRVQLRACKFVRCMIETLKQYNLSNIFTNSKTLQTLKIMFRKNDQRIKQQVCYIFANLSQTQNREEVLQYYQSSQIVKQYVFLLNGDENLVEVCLECLDQILESGEEMKERTNGDNLMLKQSAKFSGLQIVQHLLNHPSQKISQLAQNIGTKYANEISQMKLYIN